MPRRLPLLLACLLAIGTAPAVAQYKWTDAGGRTAYGDNVPRDARNVQRVVVDRGEAADPLLAGLPFELARAAQRFPVVLYSTRDCGPCATARTTLQARGVPYTELTVETAEDFETFRQRGGSNQFPTLGIGRTLMPGLDVARWNTELDAAGYPRNQLPARWSPPAPRALYTPPPPPPPAAPAYTPLGLEPSS